MIFLAILISIVVSSFSTYVLDCSRLVVVFLEQSQIISRLHYYVNTLCILVPQFFVYVMIKDLIVLPLKDM